MSFGAWKKGAMKPERWLEVALFAMLAGSFLADVDRFQLGTIVWGAIAAVGGIGALFSNFWLSKRALYLLFIFVFFLAIGGVVASALFLR